MAAVELSNSTCPLAYAYLAQSISFEVVAILSHYSTGR